MSQLKHLAIIMDGNRRWAKSKGLPISDGHRWGYEKIKEVGKWCLDKGITTLTVYAFSTENWNRDKSEVDYLMNLLHQALITEIEKFNQLGIKLKIIGSQENLSKKLIEAIATAENQTKNNNKGTLNICLNYGGRLEIVEAIKKIIKKQIPIEEIDEKIVTENLWLAGQPDPDLIIRTSGEQRLSGFLTWESVYSELLFIDKYWPDFSQADLEEAIKNYQQRQRRFGK